MSKKMQPPLSSKKNSIDTAARRLEMNSVPAQVNSLSPTLPPRQKQAGRGSSATATGQKARNVTEGSRALKGEADSFLASLRLPPAGTAAQETGAGEGAKTMHDEIELMRQQIAAKEQAARFASPQSRTQQIPATGNGKIATGSKAAGRTLGQAEKVSVTTSVQMNEADHRSHVGTKRGDVSALPQAEKQIKKALLKNNMNGGEEAPTALRGQEAIAGVKRKAAEAAVGLIDDPISKKMGGDHRELVQSETQEVGGGEIGTQTDTEASQQGGRVPQAPIALPQPASVPLPREEKGAEASSSEERQGAVVSQGSQPLVLGHKVRGTDPGAGAISKNEFLPSSHPLPAWTTTANQLIQEGLQTVRAGYAMATSGNPEQHHMMSGQHHMMSGQHHMMSGQHHMMSGQPGSSLSLMPPPSTPPVPQSWEEIQREEDAVEVALEVAQQQRRSLEVREALARRQLREATQALRAVEDECFSLKRRSQALAAARITAELNEQPPQRPALPPHSLPSHRHDPVESLTLCGMVPGDSTPSSHEAPLGGSEVHDTLLQFPEVGSLAPKEFSFGLGLSQTNAPTMLNTSTSKNETDEKGQREESEGRHGEDTSSPSLHVPSVPETSNSMPPIALSPEIVSSKKGRPASQAAMIADRIRCGILQKRSDTLLSTHSLSSRSRGVVKRSVREGEEGGQEGAQLSKRRKSIRNKMMAQINGQDPSAVQIPTSPDESRDRDQAVESEQPSELRLDTTESPASSAPNIEKEAVTEVVDEKVEAPAVATAAVPVSTGNVMGGGRSVGTEVHEPEKESQDVPQTPSLVLSETAIKVVESSIGEEDSISPEVAPPVPVTEDLTETALPREAPENGVGEKHSSVDSGDAGRRWMPLVYYTPAIHLLPPLPTPPSIPTPAVSQSEAERDGEVMRRYQSPLSCLRTWRLSPRFPLLTKASPQSLTWNNFVDPTIPLCKFELRGICNDTLCPAQHRKTYQLPTPTPSPNPTPETPAPNWWVHNNQPKAQKVKGRWEEEPEVLYSIEGQVMRSPDWDAPTLQACVRGEVRQSLHSAADRWGLPKGCVVLGGRVGGLGIDPHPQEVVGGRYYNAKDVESEAEGWEDFVEEALHCTDFRLDSAVPSEARNKAICTLVRFLEVSPQAPVPWVLYLLLYRGAHGARGSSPSHIHNLCKTAVRYNSGCYELWSLYCSVGSSVEQSIGITEEALSGLAAHSKEEATVLSAQPLSLCLQLLQRCCIAGEVGTACSWLAHLLTTAEKVAEIPAEMPAERVAEMQAERAAERVAEMPGRKEERTRNSAFLRCLLPGDRAVLWITAAYLSAHHCLPPPVTHALGCHQTPLSCLDLDWHGKEGPRPESAQAVTRIFEYACGKELGTGPTALQAQIALSVNWVQYIAVTQGILKAQVAVKSALQRFGSSSPELLMLQAQCGVEEEDEIDGREQREWLFTCRSLTDSERDGAAGAVPDGDSRDVEGDIECLAEFWVVMREGLQAAIRNEDDKGRELSFKAFQWAMEGDSVSLQRWAVRQLAGLIHRLGETARVQAVVEVLTWLSASNDRWHKFTGRSKPLSNLSRLARDKHVQSCLSAVFERTPKQPWMLNQLWGEKGLIPLDTPHLGLVDVLQDLCPGNISALARCVKEKVTPGMSSWLAGLLIAALREEQSGTVAGSGYDTWVEAERELRRLNQNEAAVRVSEMREALHRFSLQGPVSVPPGGQNGVAHY